MGTQTTLITALFTFCTSHALAGSNAWPEHSPAKGEKKCTISQLESEFLTNYYNRAFGNISANRPALGLKAGSALVFRVYKNGRLTVSFSRDTYPGSKLYVLVDGKRYIGDANRQLPLDARAIAALKQDKLIDYTYTGWPGRDENNMQDIFAGFAEAYEKCVAFMAH